MKILDHVVFIKSIMSLGRLLLEREGERAVPRPFSIAVSNPYRMLCNGKCDYRVASSLTIEGEAGRRGEALITQQNQQEQEQQQQQQQQGQRQSAILDAVGAEPPPAAAAAAAAAATPAAPANLQGTSSTADDQQPKWPPTKWFRFPFQFAVVSQLITRRPTPPPPPTDTAHCWKCCFSCCVPLFTGFRGRDSTTLRVSRRRSDVLCSSALESLLLLLFS